MNRGHHAQSLLCHHLTSTRLIFMKNRQFWGGNRQFLFFPPQEDFMKLYSQLLPQIFITDATAAFNMATGAQLRPPPSSAMPQCI